MFQDYGQRWWPSVKCSNVKGIITDSRRGLYKLHVAHEKFLHIWEKVRKLTIRGRLGYMSTHSPHTHFEDRMICIWVRKEERKRVSRSLRDRKLYQYKRVFEYWYEPGEKHPGWSEPQGLNVEVEDDEEEGRENEEDEDDAKENGDDPENEEEGDEGSEDDEEMEEEDDSD